MPDPNLPPSDQPLDNLHGAPLPPPHPPAPDGSQILETPEELRQRQEREKGLREDAEAGAALAATGVGCAAAALMPWLIGGAVLLIAFLFWLFHGGR